MWIVTRDWGMESVVDSFETEESAKEFFEEWAGFSDARIYLAKVIYEKETVNIWRNSNASHSIG